MYIKVKDVGGYRHIRRAGFWEQFCSVHVNMDEAWELGTVIHVNECVLLVHQRLYVVYILFYKKEKMMENYIIVIEF